MIQWNRHYTRSKSSLSFPDENLVRLLMKSETKKNFRFLDMGTGSGRHLQLLDTLGFENNTGTDISLEGLKLADYTGSKRLCCADNLHLPFKDDTFNCIIAWGSLHYNHKNDFPVMISEILRTLQKGGSLFATLRSTHDTHLRKGKNLGNNVWQTDLNDIKGSLASFYSKKEIFEYFSDFSRVATGLMERTLMGNLDTRISHWIIEAIK